jgi:hypothetical protein
VCKMADRSGGAAYADEHIIVFRSRDSLLVAPRDHVSSVTHLPRPRLSAFLAALRCVCMSVEATSDRRPVRVEVLDPSTRTPLHVCLRVSVPLLSEHHGAVRAQSIGAPGKGSMPHGHAERALDRRRGRPHCG